MSYSTIIKLAEAAVSHELATPPSAGLDWKTGLLGTPLATITQRLALNSYIKNILTPFEYNTAGNLDPKTRINPWQVLNAPRLSDLNNNPLPENVKATQILKRFARSKGVEFTEHSSPLAYAYAPPAAPGRGFGHPRIATGLNEAPGPIAHEIGHFNGPKKLMTKANVIGSNIASRLGSGLGTMGALWSSNEDNSRNAGLAGSAANIPTLAAEVDASIRGGSLLKRLGRSRAGAFTGLPTYGVMAATPLLAHYAKKLLGGFSKKVAPEGVLPQLN
jgi:hypothetical protein